MFLFKNILVESRVEKFCCSYETKEKMAQTKKEKDKVRMGTEVKQASSCKCSKEFQIHTVLRNPSKKTVPYFFSFSFLLPPSLSLSLFPLWRQTIETVFSCLEKATKNTEPKNVEPQSVESTPDLGSGQTRHLIQS